MTITAVERQQVLHALDGYRAASGVTRSTVVQHASGLWTGLGSWRDADVARFVKQVVPVVKAGRRQMGSLTDAYLASISRIRTGTGSPVGVRSSLLDEIRGVPLDEVYRRPGVTTWTAVGNGVSWGDAMRQGLNRLQGMVATDMQLAKTWAARDVLNGDQRVIGYMRVTSGACCELCDDASDNAYHSDDLMPIHNNCNCDVEPLYAGHDTTDLSQRQESWVARDAGGTVVSDKGNVPEVRDHGELGPVLTVKGQQFTGPDDLAA